MEDYSGQEDQLGQSVFSKTIGEPILDATPSNTYTRFISFFFFLNQSWTFVIWKFWHCGYKMSRLTMFSALRIKTSMHVCLALVWSCDWSHNRNLTKMASKEGPNALCFPATTRGDDGLSVSQRRALIPTPFARSHLNRGDNRNRLYHCRCEKRGWKEHSRTGLDHMHLRGWVGV